MTRIKFVNNRRDFLRTIAAGAVATHASPQMAAPAGSQDFPSLAYLRAEHDRRGTIPPNKTYRTMEWSLHFPPQGKFDFDLEGAMKQTRAVGTESVLFYAQDHWGYALYPSDVGVRHPNLTNDFFGKQVELAHRLGMSVIAYYSLQYNNQVVLSHPDWGWINEQAVQQRRRSRWYLPCLDSPYRQYALGMLEEIFSRYEFEQFFFDCYAIQYVFYHREGRDPFCFCKYTEAAWDKDHPGDPYREGFKTSQGWEARFQWLQKRSMYDFLESVDAIRRKYQPQALLTLNGGPEVFPDDLLQKVAYIYAEPLACATGISLGSILMRGWGRPDYQAGVFTMWPYIDDAATVPLRVEADSLIVQNARVFFIGETPLVAHVDGQSYSERWFDRARDCFADVRQVDSLLGDIQPVYSTAMFYSEATREEADAQKRPLDFNHSTLGALETLTYAGRPVESLPGFRLTPEMLRNFELLVLPEVDALSDAHAEVIRQWVKDGGTLVASYRCGLLDEQRHPRSNFPLADVFGVDFRREEKKFALDNEGRLKENFISTYLEPSNHRLGGMFGKRTVGLPGPFLYLGRNAAEEVMHYRPPIMVEDFSRNQWYHWGPPPPGAETVGPAVTYNRFGKGQAVYIGVPIFRAMSTRIPWSETRPDRPFWIREWIPELVRQLVPNPIAELAPVPFTEYVHGSFFYDQSRRFVLVQILNTVEQLAGGKLQTAVNVEVRLNPGKLRVTNARVLWPKTLDLPLETSSGKTRMLVPNVTRYTALYLKLAAPRALQGKST